MSGGWGGVDVCNPSESSHEPEFEAARAVLPGAVGVPRNRNSVLGMDMIYVTLWRID